MAAAESAAVVLPTYNEIETAPTIVSQLLEFDTVSEIVVVDDDSPDGTAQVIRERWSEEPAVRVIRRTTRSGLASAVLRGIGEAEAPVVAVMDADGQHPTGTAVQCAQIVADGADLCVGSRHTDTGRVAADWPLRRRLVSRAAELLARTAVPQARPLSDPMSGLFAIRRDLVMGERLQPRGYKILLEIVARCSIEDVREVGYTFERRDEGASNLGVDEYLAFCVQLAALAAPARRSRTIQVTPEVADG